MKLSAMWMARAKNWPHVLKYCLKKATSVDGFEKLMKGDAVMPAQGKRTDLELLYEFMKPLSASALPKREIVKLVMDRFPGEYMKMHAGIDKMINAGRPDFKPFLIGQENFYKWQKDLHTYLSGPVEPRRILAIVGKKGGDGKSAMRDFIFHNMNGLAISGKLADMAYMVLSRPECKIVVFDVTRTAADFSAHLASFAENMKDGIVMSTKYESEVRAVNPKHVVFFFNELPLGFRQPTVEGKMFFSADRLHVWNVYKDGYECIMPE